LPPGPLPALASMLYLRTLPDTIKIGGGRR